MAIALQLSSTNPVTRHLRKFGLKFTGFILTFLFSQKLTDMTLSLFADSTLYLRKAKTKQLGGFLLMPIDVRAPRFHMCVEDPI